jgi:hypothetical protein
MTINGDSGFSLQIDQQLLSIEDVGQHKIEITLSDDGPIPKFDSKISFMLGIEFTPMDPLEKQELLELIEFEK